MRIEITPENAVKIYNDGETIPFWFQPDYPNGDAFDSSDEAKTWALLAVAAYDETQPYAPEGKGMAGRPKPTAEELAAAKKALEK